MGILEATHLSDLSFSNSQGDDDDTARVTFMSSGVLQFLPGL